METEPVSVDTHVENILNDDKGQMSDANPNISDIEDDILEVRRQCQRGQNL